MLRSAMAGALISALASGPVGAEPVADFYKGKQIRFIIRAGVGGTYDLYARLLLANGPSSRSSRRMR